MMDSYGKTRSNVLYRTGQPVDVKAIPGEGHMISRPEHRRDVVERSVGWFDRFLGADLK
jgi:dipeptidyl aminopeptidase/acylaminoacyl peptidase